MSIPGQFLKFKALLQFFDEMGANMGCTLDDIQAQAPHYFTVIKKKIEEAETDYQADNAHELDVKLRAVKQLFFTAVKYIEKKKKGK